MANYPVLPIPSSEFKPSIKVNTSIMTSESGYEHRRKKGASRKGMELVYRGIDSNDRKTLKDFYESVYGNVTNFTFYDFEALARYDTTYVSGYHPWSQPGYSQRFFTTRTANLNVARLYLKKLGSPTGNITAKIYDDSGGNPGTLLATSSTTLNVTTLTTSASYYDFDFTDYSLTKSIYYHLLFEVTGYTWVDGVTEIQIGRGTKKTNEPLISKNLSTYIDTGYTSIHLFTKKYKMRFANDEFNEEFRIGDRVDLSISLIEDF